MIYQHILRTKLVRNIRQTVRRSHTEMLLIRVNSLLSHANIITI